MAGMPGAAQPLTPQTGNALLSALSSQAAPENAATKLDRIDPTETMFTNQNRIRRSLDKAIEDADAADPLVAIFRIMRGAMKEILQGVKPETVAQTMLQGLTGPPVAAPAMGMGGPMAPTAGAGIPMPAPVSPGPPSPMGSPMGMVPPG